MFHFWKKIKFRHFTMFRIYMKLIKILKKEQRSKSEHPILGKQSSSFVNKFQKDLRNTAVVGARGRDDVESPKRENLTNFGCYQCPLNTTRPLFVGFIFLNNDC